MMSNCMVVGIFCHLFFLLLYFPLPSVPFHPTLPYLIQGVAALMMILFKLKALRKQNLFGQTETGRWRSLLWISFNAFYLLRVLSFLNPVNVGPWEFFKTEIFYFWYSLNILGWPEVSYYNQILLVWDPKMTFHFIRGNLVVKFLSPHETELTG